MPQAVPSDPQSGKYAAGPPAAAHTACSRRVSPLPRLPHNHTGSRPAPSSAAIISALAPGAKFANTAFARSVTPSGSCLISSLDPPAPIVGAAISPPAEPPTVAQDVIDPAHRDGHEGDGTEHDHDPGGRSREMPAARRRRGCSAPGTAC